MPDRTPAAALRPVIAVVAAHRPDPALLENLRALTPQVDAVVVVDDGSGPAWSERLRATVERAGSTVELLSLEQNAGIAAALNAGVRRAVEAGARAVLTLDQDTRLDARYVEAAEDAVARLDRRRRPFAAIAAGVQSSTPVRPVHYEDRGARLTPTLEAIQSGLLIPRAVLERIGLFDEQLFIDCVDTDFVLRAAAAGLPTYLARDCSIEHGLGREIATAGLCTSRSGRTTFAFHPPWRRYYISRNRMLMVGRHGPRNPLWAAVSTAGEAVQLLRSIVFGPDKVRQGAAVVLGGADALLGRRGRLVGRTALLLGAPR